MEQCHPRERYFCDLIAKDDLNPAGFQQFLLNNPENTHISHFDIVWLWP